MNDATDSEPASSGLEPPHKRQKITSTGDLSSSSSPHSNVSIPPNDNLAIEVNNTNNNTPNSSPPSFRQLIAESTLVKFEPSPSGSASVVTISPPLTVAQANAINRRQNPKQKKARKSNPANEQRSNSVSEDVMMGAYLLSSISNLPESDDVPMKDEKSKAGGVPLGNANSRTVCANCKTPDTPLWRKGWTDDESGRSVLLCNACGLLYAKNHYCPYCKFVYKYRKDVHMKEEQWLHCCHCRRWVHLECERKFGTNPPVQQTLQIIQSTPASDVSSSATPSPSPSPSSAAPSSGQQPAGSSGPMYSYTIQTTSMLYLCPHCRNRGVQFGHVQLYPGNNAPPVTLSPQSLTGGPATTGQGSTATSPTVVAPATGSQATSAGVTALPPQTGGTTVQSSSNSTTTVNSNSSPSSPVRSAAASTFTSSSTSAFSSATSNISQAPSSPEASARVIPSISAALRKSSHSLPLQPHPSLTHHTQVPYPPYPPVFRPTSYYAPPPPSGAPSSLLIPQPIHSLPPQGVAYRAAPGPLHTTPMGVPQPAILDYDYTYRYRDSYAPPVPNPIYMAPPSTTMVAPPAGNGMPHGVPAEYYPPYSIYQYPSNMYN